MRATRLLQMLLLLQNRGRMTSAQLAEELEVARRTILRDVDAMTEAGLPIIVHQGSRGGIELGFNYRTRLTGLDASEAEALGILIARPVPELASLGMDAAARRAISKLVESFPDTVRERIAHAQKQFVFEQPEKNSYDVRVIAMANAIRGTNVVRLAATSSQPRLIHPVQLRYEVDNWNVVDGLSPEDDIPIRCWGDLNISSKTFEITGCPVIGE